MKPLIGQQESNRKHQEKRRRAAGIPTREQIRARNMQIFVQVSEKVHKNKYNYSDVVYVNSLTKVKIKCPNHDIFHQIPHAHKDGQGCPECALRKKHNGFRKSLKSFISESNIVHDNKYDYSETFYVNNKTKVDIICPEHGKFSQQAKAHLHGQGCPCCGAAARISITMSKGETKILNFLKNHHVDFIPQQTFKDCKY